MEHASVNDRPITHPANDKFGFNTFAEGLATCLLKIDPKDGVVVSLEGPWGSGKSSIVELALRTIKRETLKAAEIPEDQIKNATDETLEVFWLHEKHQRNVHIVRYNPWIFSGQQNLVAAFFSELASQLGFFKRNKAEIMIDAVRKIGGILTPFLNFAALTNPTAEPIAKAAGSIAETISKLANRSPLKETLEDSKVRLAAELNKSHQRIIVIIDDIDRLLPEEMRQVLSLVKALGDLPNLLYLLIFDSEVVTKSLQLPPAATEPTFLEKLIQVRFKAPPTWKDELRTYFFSRLDHILLAELSATKFMKNDIENQKNDRWIRMFLNIIYQYLSTPRDVNRLVSEMQLVWPIVESHVDISDFITLTTLKLFEPEVYNFINREIEYLTYAEINPAMEDDLAKRTQLENLNQPEAAEQALINLFPSIADAKKKGASDNADGSWRRQEKRICTPEHYRNYFLFSGNPNAFSRADLERITNSTTPKTEWKIAINRINAKPEGERGKVIDIFLLELTDLIKKECSFPVKLLEAILDFSDELISREDLISEIYIDDNASRLMRLIMTGIENVEQTEKLKLLDRLTGYPPGLHLRTLIIRRYGWQHNLIEPRVAARENNKTFSEKETASAVKLIKLELERACKSGKIWQSPDPMRLIVARYQMGDTAATREWLNKAIQNEKHIVAIAKGVLHIRFTPEKEFGFDKEFYSDILNVDQMLSNLEIFARQNLEAREALKEIKEAMRNSSEEDSDN